MQKQYALMLIVTLSLTAQLLAQTYTISNNGQTYTVKEQGKNRGQLEDGTPVQITCIRKGMIGMPNISMPNYRGQYTNANGERCYVFAVAKNRPVTRS